MSDKSNEYGYVAGGPTQAAGSNSGIFDSNDVVDLLNQGKWTLQTFDAEYLVIAGGGSGAGSGAGGGGGGAGGYRNSYASETSGGNSSTETPLTIPFYTSVTVTVGAGGASAVNSANRGNDSVLYTVTSIAGGAGYRGGLPTDEEDGGSGGGSTNGSGTQGLGTVGQGKDGGYAIDGAGGGGGASANGSNGVFNNGGAGGNGLASSITGSSVTRAGGGGGGSASVSGALGGSGGSGGAGAGGNYNNNGSNATVNRGSGGGGSGGNNGYGGNGSSGIVVIRYPSDKTITVGAGLTSSTSTVGSDKVTTFTAGTDSVSFS